MNYVDFVVEVVHVEINMFKKKKKKKKKKKITTSI